METRFGKLGRLEAKWFCRITSSLLGFDEGRKYATEFLKEFGNYSNMPRKKGEEENAGCVRELENIEDVDDSPKTYALIVKERLHTKYQKQNTSREYAAYVKEVRRFFEL